MVVDAVYSGFARSLVSMMLIIGNPCPWCERISGHYCDVKMGAMASQITSLTIVYSIVYSDADQRKHQSSASLAFVWRIHRWPVNSPHKWPVTRKMFPFDDLIMFGTFISGVKGFQVPTASKSVSGMIENTNDIYIYISCGHSMLQTAYRNDCFTDKLVWWIHKISLS